MAGKRIMVAVNASAYSTEAIKVACEIFVEDRGDTLTIVSVSQKLPYLSGRVHAREIKEAQEEVNDETLRILEKYVNLAKLKGVPADRIHAFRKISTDIPEALCRVAKKRQPDLLVIGTHKMQYRIGNTSEYVVHNAPCKAILVAKFTDHQSN